MSRNLVHWEEVEAPSAFGGTGGMVIDDDGAVVAYAMGGGR